MESYVVELQNDIINNGDISSILNKALVISNELEIKEFNDWINLELKGYKEDMDKIPDYRIIECEIRGDAIKSSIGGYVTVSNSPIQGMPDEINELLREVHVHQSLPEIIHICKLEEDFVRFKLDFHQEEILMKYIPNATEIYRACPLFQLEAIIDHVKHELLNWCSELKKRDIFGESYIFTDNEKETAKSIKYVVLNNSSIHIGDNNLILSDNSYADIILNLGQIRNILKDNDIEGKICKKIYNNSVDIENELKNEKPNLSNINRALAIMKNFAGQIASSTIASLLIEHIDEIMVIISNIQLPF